MLEIFPNYKDLMNDYPIQSKLFGHRFRQDQTLYEYLLEFLIVAFSKKKINENEDIKELFPINIPTDKAISYYPENGIALKRFVFFDKSKEEGKFELDKLAYKEHLSILKENIEINCADSLDEEYAIKIIQNLLYGFSAVIETRSWFAQSLLPICKETLICESMGDKKKRNKPKESKEWDTDSEEFIKKVDSEFEFNRYNFMARGGEVYYLHVLKAINDYPQYKEQIESGFENLICQFNEMSRLCKFVKTIWRKEVFFDESENNNNEKKIKKKLGTIPSGFDGREEQTLKELSNLLHSDLHPFDKIEILANGMILQMMAMCHNQARYLINKEKSYFLFDINCYKNKSDDEVKKLATNCYGKYEQDFISAIYGNLNKNTKSIDEKDVIKNAIDDSLKVYKKMGKKIGIIRPVNEKNTRFTMSENILKFLVTSLVKPNTRVTLDRFLDKLYAHFNIVISKEQYKLEIEKGNSDYVGDLAFLEKNKDDFQLMLKECGFLKELSDSTSIVENPYGEV